LAGIWVLIFQAAPPDIWSQAAETLIILDGAAVYPLVNLPSIKGPGRPHFPFSSLKTEAAQDLEDRNAYLNLPRSSRACPLLFIISGLSGIAVGCGFPASPASPVDKGQRDDSQLGDPEHNAIID
jgi:hypothetical protein